MLNAPHIRASQGDFDPKVFLGRTEPGRTIEKYEKSRKIFSQGDVADSVFFIHKGKVKVTVLSEHGKEAVVGIFTEGQFFGEQRPSAFVMFSDKKFIELRIPDQVFEYIKTHAFAEFYVDTYPGKIFRARVHSICLLYTSPSPRD